MTCRPYDGGDPVKAFTLMAAQGSLMNSKEGDDASLGFTGAVRPSKRYLDILKEGQDGMKGNGWIWFNWCHPQFVGANHHGLDQEYKDWLGKVRPYDRESLGQKLGFYVATSTALSLALPLVIPVVALSKVGVVKMEVSDPAAPSAAAASAPKVSDAAAKSASSSSPMMSASEERARQQQQEAALPAWLGTGYSVLNKTIWVIHDWAWAPVLGKGR